MRKIIITMMVILSLIFSTVVSYAGSDPHVVLVNPAANSTVYSNSLLISVKLTQPKTIQVRVYEEMQLVNGTWSAINLSTITTSNGTVNTNNFKSFPVVAAAKFESPNNLSFYTKQINGMDPGLYRIQIDTLDSAGKVVYTTNSYVAMKEKTAEADAKIFETPQSGTMQFLQNLLKTIFGS